MQKRSSVEGASLLQGRNLDPGATCKVILVLSIILQCMMGCSFNSYQSPEVLPPGKTAIGLGLGGGGWEKSDLWFLEAAGYWRVGVGKNCEWGIKLSPFTGIYSDIKLQMLKKPILLAFDIGASFYPSWTHYNYMQARVDSYPAYTGLYPTLLLGTEHVYGGIKFIFINEQLVEMLGDMLLPGIMLGVSLGSKMQFKPEVNFYYDILSDSPLLTVGFGLQADLKDFMIKKSIETKSIETEKYKVKLDNQTDYKAELYIHGSTYHAIASPHISIIIEDIVFRRTDYSLKVTDNSNAVMLSVRDKRSFKVGLNTCVVNQDSLGKTICFWE